MSIANMVTRIGPSVSSAAKIAYVVTHGLGDFTPAPPSTGGIHHVHRRRGQPGAIIRGAGPHGGQVA